MTAIAKCLERAEPFRHMVGAHPTMEALRDAIRRAGSTDAPVVIWGQTGAGKEVAARALHEASRETSGPFCPVNLAAVPEGLIEGELFGVKRGAFTGATSDRAGLIETAAGGTLFLDEAGDLPLGIQTKLLRVLESGEVRRVGATRGVSVRFRLIVATQENPVGLRDSGRWRTDLFYRLAGVVLRVPTLSERRSDITELTRVFCAERGLALPDKRALRVLGRQAWPGNVRELQHTLLRASFLADHGDIRSEHIRAAVKDGTAQVPSNLCTLLEVQRTHVESVVAACDGDTARAALILGVSRRHVYRYLRPWTRASSRH